MARVTTKEEFAKIKEELRAEGKKIVLCHGVFDLVHPGHIIHFEEAKKMGDVLVVSVTAAKFVRKGPDRPYFDDEMRLRFLSAISCIDYVLLSEGYTVEDTVEAVEPEPVYAPPRASAVRAKIRSRCSLVTTSSGPKQPLP